MQPEKPVFAGTFNAYPNSICDGDPLRVELAALKTDVISATSPDFF